MYLELQTVRKDSDCTGMQAGGETCVTGMLHLSLCVDKPAPVKVPLLSTSLLQHANDKSKRVAMRNRKPIEAKLEDD